LTVLVSGCATLEPRWSHVPALRHVARQTLAALEAQLATAIIAAATLTAGGILAIVALHLLTDWTPIPYAISSKLHRTSRSAAACEIMDRLIACTLYRRTSPSTDIPYCSLWSLRRPSVFQYLPL
jgi:hypothetical protein